MKKTVWLMCGPPASGKSTWATLKMKELPNSCWISRDMIRFNLLSDEEDYFAHEDKVFDNFIKYANEALNLYDNLFIDATHVSKASRRKTLSRLNLESDYEVIAVNMLTSLESCLERNSHRTGRANVPDSAIRQIHFRFNPAKLNEDYITQVIAVKEEDM